MKRKALLLALCAMLVTSPAWANYLGDLLKVSIDAYSSTIKIVDNKNLKVGNGTPTVTQNGEDMYVEGTFEVDGAARFDGATTFTSTVTMSGASAYVDLPEVSAPASPAANVGRLYSLDVAGTTSLYYKDNAGVATNLLTVGGGTLDQAYDQGGVGVGRTINATDGAVNITSTDADAAFLLTVTPTPGAGAATGGVQITSGANSTQDSLQIANSGSGDDIQAGGGNFKVSAAGNVNAADGTFTGALTAGTLYQAAIAAASGGNVALTVDAAGNGTITLGGTSTGLINLNRAVTMDEAVTLGDASGDNITVNGTIVSNLAIDDGVTDSPSVTFQDATNETAVLAKVDGGEFSVTTAANRSLQVLTGNLRVGNGVPGTAAMNGEDFYVNGDSEFDGAIQADGAITTGGLFTGTAGATISGAAINLNVNSNFATNIGTGTTTQTVTIGGNSNTVAVNSSDWDMTATGQLSGVASVDFDAAAANVTLATSGDAQDLTIRVTGANNSSLVLSSAGTAADALQVTTTAGGMDFTITGAAADEDMDFSTDSSINFTTTEAVADQFKVSANGAVGGNAINLLTADGGIVLTAAGAANGDMTLTVGDDFALNSTGDIVLNSADWDISATGAQTGMASVTFDSATGIYYDTVECNNSCIKGLRAAKLELTGAPGAANFIELDSVVLILDYGSEVLTVNAADNLVVEYETSGQDATAAIETDGFLTAAADTMQMVPAAAIATVPAANILNKKLLLFNVGGAEFAGNASNDTTMTIKVAYRIHAGGL